MATLEITTTDGIQIAFYLNPENGLWYFGEILPESNKLFAHEPIGGFHDKSTAYEAAVKLGYKLPSWVSLRRIGRV